MNKNTGIIVGLLVLIVIGGVYATTKNGNEEVMVDTKTEKSTETMTEDSNMMKKDEVVAKGTYESYSSQKIARAEMGDVVIFFHASWCPSCRALNSDIEANLNSIPVNVSILKADYDKENELKKKYGVTSQHTLVQVDKDGNLIKKWSGGSKLSNVLSEIN